MSVSNLQLADQTTFNNAFVSRSADDNTTGKKSLENADAVSGANVSNVQREINSLNSFTGRTSGSAFNAVPSWINNDVGTLSDDVFMRAEALTTKFNETTGHTHNGTAGEGPPISASSITGLNYYRVSWRYLTAGGAIGTSNDYSAAFFGETPGGDNATEGVITGIPNNKVYLIDLADGTAIKDSNGLRVYGRLTEAAGVWTISYYVNAGGVETATSINADIAVYYKQVYNLDTLPTISTDQAETVPDVLDASATTRGLVSTGTQTFAGAKTFTGSTTLASVSVSVLSSAAQNDNTTTGSNATITPSGSVLVHRLINASLVSVDMIVNSGVGKFLWLHNKTGAAITISNETGATTSNRILTGTGASITLPNNGAIGVFYDTIAFRWQIVGGLGGSSGGAFVSSSFTGTTFSCSSDGFQRWRYTGASAQTLATITTGSLTDGAIINILGTSDANTITLDHNDVSSGWLLNGSWTGTLGSILSLQWDSTLSRLVEVSRNG